jgi:hypothetical protein
VYKAIAVGVWILHLFIHLGLIQYVIYAVLPPDSHPLWGIPFAVVYAVFMGITMGITYYYILPKKSRIYWED